MINFCAAFITMKKPSQLIIMTAAIFISSGLPAQNLKNLEDNNGFKTYKLGTRYVIGTGIKVKNEEGGDKVVLSVTREKIGDIPVKTIELYYLKDTLSKIIVKVSPEHYAGLIDACKSAFGQPTEDRSDNAETRKSKTGVSNQAAHYTDHYVWKTRWLSLEYFYIYPVVSGGYGVKELYLVYMQNDFTARLQRMKMANSRAKNF